MAERNGQFAQYDEIELVAMTDCGDCPGLVFSRVKLLNEITKGLDRPFDVLHLGTCMQVAMETGNCPIDFDDLQFILEKKFNIKVVLGTHDY
jgi:predicted metal-binding protein